MSQLVAVEIGPRDLSNCSDARSLLFRGQPGCRAFHFRLAPFLVLLRDGLATCASRFLEPFTLVNELANVKFRRLPLSLRSIDCHSLSTFLRLFLAASRRTPAQFGPCGQLLLGVPLRARPPTLSPSLLKVLHDLLRNFSCHGSI